MQKSENRLTFRLIRYWNSLKKGFSLPEFRWFNRNSVGDLWEYCFCLEVYQHPEGPPTMSYIHFGSKLVEMSGQNFKAQPLTDEINKFPGVKMVERLYEMLDKPEEMSEEGEFVNYEKKLIKFRACALPFGAPSSGEVSHIVGCVSWKEFAK